MDPCYAYNWSEKGQGEGRPFQGQRVEVASQRGGGRRKESQNHPLQGDY